MKLIGALKKNIVTEFRSIDRGILYSALLLMFFGLFLTFMAIYGIINISIRIILFFATSDY